MRKLWLRLPIPLKLALPATLLCLLSSLSVVALLQQNQQQLVAERLHGLGGTLASRLAAAAAPALVQEDAIALQAVVGGFAAETTVARAAVFDAAGNLEASAGDGADTDFSSFSAPARWQDATVGRVELTLNDEAGGSSLVHTADLLLVAIVASLCGGAFAWWAGWRVDGLLGRLARQLAGEQVPLIYGGQDSLGRLLDTPPPPLLTEAVAPPQRRAAVLMQLYTADHAAANRLLEQTETVAELYGGDAQINRAGGVLARFPVEADDAAFQALCAAALITELCHGTDVLISLTHLDEAAAADPWQEQQVVELAYDHCLVNCDGPTIALDEHLAGEAAVRDRTELAAFTDRPTALADSGAWFRLLALRAPYDALLRRQLAALTAHADA
ncbi:MAG: hypothetical protein RBS88_12350 [Spongiibacteraceae bacterium]|jgi:hypothetical protein|nr:hypothetical protein [Spongiibacteraceae bacterium]